MRYDFLGLCEATGFRERVTWARHGTGACKVTLLQVRLSRESRPEFGAQNEREMVERTLDNLLGKQFSLSAVPT